MHECFVAEMKQKKEKSVSYTTYLRIFKNFFTLKIKPPKSDTCGKCDAYKILPDDQKLARYEEIVTHHAQSDRVRSQYATDAKEAVHNKKLCVITFDLQKTHGIPDVTANENYYKRHLNVFNFSVHVSDGKGKLFFI